MTGSPVLKVVKNRYWLPWYLLWLFVGMYPFSPVRCSPVTLFEPEQRFGAQDSQGRYVVQNKAVLEIAETPAVRCAFPDIQISD